MIRRLYFPKRNHFFKKNTTITINNALTKEIEMIPQRDKLLLGFKQLALFGAVLGLVFGTGAVSFDDAFASGKVYVCHDGKNKKIDHDDLYDHLEHGDTKGKCKKEKKIYVCHEGENLKIKESELEEHLLHGDTEGKCKKFKAHDVITGDGPPPDKLGKEGDLYLDSWNEDSLEYYVKVGKNEWEFRGIIVEINSACDIRDIIKFDGTKWLCADDLDTLGNLTCSDGQIAKRSGTEWVCAEDGGGETLTEAEVEEFITNGAIDLFAGSTLDGDAISTEPDLVDDADSSPTNELQTLSQSGSDVTLSDGGGTVSIDDADANDKNELQSILVTTESKTGSGGDPLHEIEPEESASGSVTCDADYIAIGFEILWVQSNGIPVVTNLEFIGAAVDYDIANASTFDAIEVNVMAICMKLIPIPITP